MGKGSARPVVLDTGALIAFERGDSRIRSLVELAMRHGGVLHVPGGVVAQAWRDGRRQTRLARLLASGLVQVQALDGDEARATGVVCAQSKTNDIVDASVVLLARRHRAPIVTSDPDDISRIDASVEVIPC
ncbi:MAG: PIN domain-containing protein [Acidobacteriota bacterium]